MSEAKTQRRLQFIDFRLFWDGRFNRNDLAKTFGISVQQASSDINDYMQLAKQNLRYDHQQRAYFRTAEYSPALLHSAAERYLLQLVAIEQRWMGQEETWFDEMPPVENVEIRRKQTDSRILLQILDAIRGHKQFALDYASLTGSTEGARMIAPHALAHAGGRWYVRAWSREHNDFRDYSIDRIRSVEGLEPATVDPALDFEWHHVVDLVVIPNPELPPERRVAVAAEYAMTGDQLKVPMRVSLTVYLMALYNLDIEPGVLSPFKQQLVLKNREEVVGAREITRRLSVEALARSAGQ